MSQEQFVIKYNSTSNALLREIDPNSLADPNEECSICHVEFKDSQADEYPDTEKKVIVESICGHRFCSRCINEHITYLIEYPHPQGDGKFRCPTCRREWNIVWDPSGPAPPGDDEDLDEANGDDMEFDQIMNAAMVNAILADVIEFNRRFGL